MRTLQYDQWIWMAANIVLLKSAATVLLRAEGQNSD